MAHPASTSAEVDQAIADVCAKREAWKDTSLQDKQVMLKQCHKLLCDYLVEFCQENADRKGTHGQGLGEEMCACANC